MNTLYLKMTQSPLCDELIVAPGNAGIAQIARCIKIVVEDSQAITDLAVSEKIDFVS